MAHFAPKAQFQVTYNFDSWRAVRNFVLDSGETKAGSMLKDWIVSVAWKNKISQVISRFQRGYSGG